MTQQLVTIHDIQAAPPGTYVTSTKYPEKVFRRNNNSNTWSDNQGALSHDYLLDIYAPLTVLAADLMPEITDPSDTGVISVNNMQYASWTVGNDAGVLAVPGTDHVAVDIYQQGTVRIPNNIDLAELVVAINSARQWQAMAKTTVKSNTLARS